MSSLRMIEVLGKNSKTIMNAQRARGVETEGNVFVRMRAFFPSIVPLVLSAVTNTEERVLTLESKGFDTNCAKTRIFEVEKNGHEALALGCMIALALGVVIWKVLLWVR